MNRMLPQFRRAAASFSLGLSQQCSRNLKRPPSLVSSRPLPLPQNRLKHSTPNPKRSNPSDNGESEVEDDDEVSISLLLVGCLAMSLWEEPGIESLCNPDSILKHYFGPRFNLEMAALGSSMGLLGAHMVLFRSSFMALRRSRKAVDVIEWSGVPILACSVVHYWELSKKWLNEKHQDKKPVDGEGENGADQKDAEAIWAASTEEPRSGDDTT